MDELLAQLRAALETAVTAHYQRVTAEHDDIYGYALSTVDTVEYVQPYANRESALELTPDDDDYALYRFMAVEWKLDDDHGLFGEVHKTLRLINRKAVDLILGRYTGDDADQVKNARELVLHVCLDVLKKLEAEGLFGKRTKKRFVSLQIADSEDKIMPRAIKELNSPSVFAQSMGMFPYFDPEE